MRRGVISDQAKAIQMVVDSPDYAMFRSHQISNHTKCFRSMLRPLLDVNSSRAEAGTDLGAIVVLAWDTSADMYTSGLSFEVSFPETTSIFNAATMFVRDRFHVDPMVLQALKTPIKLVITPSITLRDDRGATPRNRSLHKSMVLTMT